MEIPVKYFPAEVTVLTPALCGVIVTLSKAVNPGAISLFNSASAKNAAGNPDGASDA